MQSEQLTLAPLAGKTIVLIENEGVMLMYLRLLLSRAGLKVVGTAATGQEGIRIVEQHRPDIVLLDTSLLDMDSVQVCARLRQSHACVVLLTCYPDEASHELTLQSGANGYISKPADKSLLFSRLLQICGDPVPD